MIINFGFNDLIKLINLNSGKLLLKGTQHAPDFNTPKIDAYR
jgi:hypothetical protein